MLRQAAGNQTLKEIKDFHPEQEKCMDPLPVSSMNPLRIESGPLSAPDRGKGSVFQSLLDSEGSVASPSIHKGMGKIPLPPASGRPLAQPVQTSPNSRVIAAAYGKQANPDAAPPRMSDLQKYKDDQLLSNPGGDHYYLDQKRVDPRPQQQESFLGRVGKDLSDAFSNIKNCFKNLLFGGKIRYRDEDNQIREATQRGLVGSVVDFFKDMGSALSFGAWRPDGEAEPQGFMKRVGFFFSKMKEAVFGDLVQGVTGSVIHMGEDLLFAGWNLLEVVPDATIGNTGAGKDLTTAVFDNGQVALDYLTDILPGGDAWVRVHSPNLESLKPPLLYNLGMPERNTADERWRYVRNTPFRKAIETVGSLLMDVLTFRFLGQGRIFGEERHHRQ